MTAEERSFNYNDLNLDFLELSLPKVRPIVRHGVPVTTTSSFRPSAFKAKQLAQRVAQNDVLVTKIHSLENENTKLLQQLTDFQKSAKEIQELYEKEKKQCDELRIKANELQTVCAQLDSDLTDKCLHFEQLEVSMNEMRGPISYAELAVKFLKLVQKLEEYQKTIRLDKSLLADLNKYCKDKGCAVPALKYPKKRTVMRKTYKDNNIQCSLLEDAVSPMTKETQTQSTQTITATNNDKQTQRESQSHKGMQVKTTQTLKVELTTQGTQHISTTTTRSTSTASFIKQHTIGTCFPEPKFMPPVTAMVDEMLQLYNVSPLSPISDPQLPAEIETSKTPSEITFKSIGTCTYICNVQRQIDFIPSVHTIKRSQSSSPAPFTCDSVKCEAYITPTPSPSPPPTSTLLNLNATVAGLNSAQNLSSMQPMLSSFTQLPEMQQEMFSAVWQMAGQMFMGLLYPPANNGIRTPHLNAATDSLNQQQFNNWIYSLYESIQQPHQQTVPSPLPRSNCHSPDEQETSFDLNAANNINIMRHPSRREHSGVIQHQYMDSSSTVVKAGNGNKRLGSDESTQTYNIASNSRCSREKEQNLIEGIFKEPLEIPKRSAKQLTVRKSTTRMPSYVKKSHEKRARNKRHKDEQKQPVQITNEQLLFADTDTSSIVESNTPRQNEQEFTTAVEFCASICKFNERLDLELKHCEENSVNRVPSPIPTYVYEKRVEKPNRDFVSDVELEAKWINGSIIHVESGPKPNNLLEIDFGPKSIGNEFDDEQKVLPDVTLFNSEETNCIEVGSIEITDATKTESVTNDVQPMQCNEIVPPKSQPETEKAQKYETTFNLFGSDSEEEDYDKPRTKCSKGEENDSVILNKSTKLEKLEDPFKMSEKYTTRKAFSPLEIGDAARETANGNKVESAPETKGNKSIKAVTKEDVLKSEVCIGAIPSSLPITPCEHKANYDFSEVAEVVVTSVPITRLRLSESAPEIDELEEITPLVLPTKDMCPIDAVPSENDDSVLVIDEKEDFENIENRSDKTGLQSLSPIKYIQESRCNTSDINSDISTLLEDTQLNDLLDSPISRKICSEILCESAKELNESEHLTPRRRGRKRKNETQSIAYCKRSARLRAKQIQSTQLSREKCLSPPLNCDDYKPKYSNVNDLNDVTSTNYNEFVKQVSGEGVAGSPITRLKSKFPCAMETLPHSRAKEHINSQYQSFVELEQGAISRLTREKYNNTEVNSGSESYSTQSQDILFKNAASSSNGATQSEIADQENAKTTNSLSYPEADNVKLNNALPNEFSNYDTPSSPPHRAYTDISISTLSPYRVIPLERKQADVPYNPMSLLERLIHTYSADKYKSKTTQSQQTLALEAEFALQIRRFLLGNRDKIDKAAFDLAQSLWEQCTDCETIASVIVKEISSAPRPEDELGCDIASVQPKYLGTHLRLISILLRHLHCNWPEICNAIMVKIESTIFNYKNNNEMSLSIALNLTQLYLLAIPIHNSHPNEVNPNPARLFLAKCLYYHNLIAIPMVYEVLCWYPTTLPHRDERNYDNSDALITVIQQILMCTTYNMDSTDLRTKPLLSLLRFQYHFIPFKPDAREVLTNLMAKLKAGHLTNLKYAFAIFCKRQSIKAVTDNVLTQQLVPLAKEYYQLVQQTSDYDARIVALLECISVVVKPLPLNIDITFYLSIFERFLCGVPRPVIQEAAVMAILRLQRFGVIGCFQALANFKPYYPLQLLTKNALKTFVNRKPFIVWKSLLSKMNSC